MAVADHFDTVQKIYIAFYQRPADPAGLRYWAERVEVAGGDTGAVIDAFANSAEAEELYGDITNENIGEAVTAIYQALFGRAPDAAGLAYYEEAFANGELSAGTIALSILDGARGEDTIAINNKLEVANEFTQQVDGRDFDDASFGRGSNFAVTYDADDVEAARDILADVTAAPGTVLDANGVRDALVGQIANEGDFILTPGQGNTFTLTTGIDSLAGTSGNDTFQAVLDSAANTNTFNAFDSINGGAGTDTLNVIVQGSAAIPNGVQIQGVEIVNLDQSAGSFVRNDLGSSQTGVNAAQFVGATQVWQIGNAISIAGVGAETTAGFRNTDDDATVSFSGATGAIALDKVASGTVFTVAGNSLTTLNISGTVASAGKDADGKAIAGDLSLASDIAEPALKTVNLSLSSDFVLDTAGQGFAKVTTLDATGSTGNVEVSGVTGKTALESVLLGKGNDQIEFGLGNTSAATVTINLGEGDDTLNFSATESTLAGKEVATSATIILGAGKDQINITDFANVSAADADADTFSGLISITDFNGTDDVLTVVAADDVARYTLTNTQANEVSKAETVFDAASAAVSYAGGDLVTFIYGENTYVVYSEDATFNNGDGIVELVGFSGQLGATNFGIASVEA